MSEFPSGRSKIDRHRVERHHQLGERDVIPLNSRARQGKISKKRESELPDVNATSLLATNRADFRVHGTKVVAGSKQNLRAPYAG